jgi:exopolyphosphatase / guanosine-5'-triphosphate,3'-diphosphate pyrophosphatase
MRIAVIDCGTNTFNLLIADKTATGFKHVLRTKRVVKLGSNGIKDGIIGPVPREKALKALYSYKSILSKYKVDKVKIVGTAALRDAKNGKEFLLEIKKKTGLTIKLIDGKEEAKLIFYGVSKAMNLGDEISLIMDIGGGSVEFILCNNKKIFWKHSFRIGVARLNEMIMPGDPISKMEVKKLNDYLTKKLQPLMFALEKHPARQLIGSSGTFDTLAAIILHKTNQEKLLRGKTHYRFNLIEYKTLHKELIQSTYNERLIMPGMLRMRADMIVLASLLLTFVIRKSGIKNLHLSTYALKEGLLN